MADYEVVLADPGGGTIDSLNDFLRLQYSRGFNTEGNLSLVLPMRFAPLDIRRDYRLYVSRSVDGALPYLDGQTFWLISNISYQPQAETMTITAKDLVWVLNRRIVGYTAQTAYADKTQVELGNGNQLPIDDMMKAFVRENLGSLALDATRNISILNIAVDRSLAPTGEKQASFQKVLPVLQDLANMSAQLGTPLYFDIYAKSSGDIEFEVFADYLNVNRGSDSLSPLELTNDHLNNLSLTWEYSEEVNYIFATGSGSGAGIVLQEDGDDERIDMSPWGAMEAHLDLRDADEDSGDYIPNEISAALYGGRPRLFMSANVVDGAGAVYGRDFFYGDRVAVQADLPGFGSYSFDCLVNAFTVTADENRESVDISVRGESIT